MKFKECLVKKANSLFWFKIYAITKFEIKLLDEWYYLLWLHCTILIFRLKNNKQLVKMSVNQSVLKFVCLQIHMSVNPSVCSPICLFICVLKILEWNFICFNWDKFNTEILSKFDWFSGKKQQMARLDWKIKQSLKSSA